MKASHYQSHQPDQNGMIQWSVEENAVWHDLVARQKLLLKGRACNEYIDGLDRLHFANDTVPQLPNMSHHLQQHTGWQVAAVPALINFDKFFGLLANKQFPVATFIRTREDFDYLQEPDIFHEIFGHCPLLTNPAFAKFTHRYGQLGKNATKEQRVFLARLYWFTVEFGLVQTEDGVRIYGGGILSSPGETIHALDSNEAKRLPFDIMQVLRTPYRIDQIQPVYYVLESIEQLYALADMDIMSYVDKAIELGTLNMSDFNLPHAS